MSAFSRRMLLLSVGLFAGLFFALTRAGADVEGDRIGTQEAWRKIQSGALLVDVRSPEEFQLGHIGGAKSIPIDTLNQQIAEFGPDKKKEIVLYCKSGRRAGQARQTLIDAGYSNVYNAGAYTDLEVGEKQATE